MQVRGSFGDVGPGRPAIVTLGAFDGVHRGHQYLIKQVVGRAETTACDAVVVTFDPRPQVILRPGSTQLTGIAEKTRIIRMLGPTTLVVLPFTREVAQVAAEQFLQEMIDGISLRELWIGSDFAFGHNREGNVEFLQNAGRLHGFDVRVVTRQTLAGQELSSTAIRRLLDSGDVEAATALLGHFFRVPGTVVRGEGRGEGLGYPTANLKVSETQSLPGLGIYAAFAEVGGRRLQAAVSVGTNPTFGGTETTIEPFLLDFDGDVRDRALSLDFVQKIRDEARFEDADALVAQIDRDVDDTRRILENSAEPGKVELSAE